MTADLISRLEGLEVPDREVDQLILELLPTPPDGWGSTWPDHLTWDSLAGKTAAPVTASLDAAVALLERVLPEWFWTVDSTGHADIGSQQDALQEAFGTAKTPAIAMCIAVLKAAGPR